MLVWILKYVNWKYSQEDTSSLEGSDSLIESDSARWEFASDTNRSPGAGPHFGYGRWLFAPGIGTMELCHGLRPHSANNTSSSENCESSTSSESDSHSCCISGTLTWNSHMQQKIGRSESLSHHASCTENSYNACSDTANLSSNSISGIHLSLIEDGYSTLNQDQSHNNSSSSSETEHSLKLDVDSVSSEEEEEQIQWWLVCLKFMGKQI